MITYAAEQAASTNVTPHPAATARVGEDTRVISTVMARATAASGTTPWVQAEKETARIVYVQSEHAAGGATCRTTDKFLHVSLGSWNPIGCLVSVIDNPGNAADAARTLHTLGFPYEHIRLIAATDLLASIDGRRQRRGLLARAACTLTDWSDNASFTMEYLDEARRGHDLVVVYAPSLAQAYLAHKAVQQYGAHLVRHYGSWVVRGLSAGTAGEYAHHLGM